MTAITPKQRAVLEWFEAAAPIGQAVKIDTPTMVEAIDDIEEYTMRHTLATLVKKGVLRRVRIGWYVVEMPSATLAGRAGCAAVSKEQTPRRQYSPSGRPLIPYAGAEY